MSKGSRRQSNQRLGSASLSKSMALPPLPLQCRGQTTRVCWLVCEPILKMRTRTLVRSSIAWPTWWWSRLLSFLLPFASPSQALPARAPPCWRSKAINLGFKWMGMSELSLPCFPRFLSWYEPWLGHTAHYSHFQRNSIRLKPGLKRVLEPPDR